MLGEVNIIFFLPMCMCIRAMGCASFFVWGQTEGYRGKRPEPAQV